MITKVAELINQEAREWDEELAIGIFYAVDANKILSIPRAIGTIVIDEPVDTKKIREIPFFVWPVAKTLHKPLG